MHLPPGENLATIRSKALKGLSHSTMPFFQSFILTMMMKPNGRGSIQQLRNELAEAQLTYLTLLQQDNYPPGKQPIKEDKRLHALQAMVKTLTDKVGSLSRSPDATSTKGNGAGSPPGDKDKNNKFTSYKDRDPSAIAPNGLSNADCVRAKDIILTRMKTMPKDLSTVPTTEDIPINLDGKVVAKWCTTCLRFVLGKRMHFTKDHQGGTPRYLGNKINSHHVPASGAVPAAGLLASIPAPATTPQLPVLAPGGTNPPTFQPPPSYDFSSPAPLQRGAGHLAQGVHPDDETVLSDDFHEVYDLSDVDLSDADPRLLACLNSFNVVLPKGFGR